MKKHQEYSPLIGRFRSARRSQSWVVLEGFHALKHALRFGAEITESVTDDLTVPLKLARGLAPDAIGFLKSRVKSVSEEIFEGLAPVAHSSRIISLARRPHVTAESILSGPRPAPVIFLEEPSNLGNLGAVIRVAAGVGASGVVTSGRHDPWHPAAVRGSAGLHFAVPVARLAGPMPENETVIAIDPEGEPLRPELIEDGAVIAFGSERRGLSEELAKRAALRVGIPMREKVSSLNLATSVAVVLYVWRLPRNT